MTTTAATTVTPVVGFDQVSKTYGTVRVPGRRRPRPRGHHPDRRPQGRQALRRPGPGGAPRPSRHWGSVRFALATAGASDLIVLDEPTTGMDVSARQAFWATVREQADQGRTVLFATHCLEEADAIADRVLVLHRGRLLADGTAAEIKAKAGARRVAFDLQGPIDEAALRALPFLNAVDALGPGGYADRVRGPFQAGRFPAPTERGHGQRLRGGPGPSLRWNRGPARRRRTTRPARIGDVAAHARLRPLGQAIEQSRAPHAADLAVLAVLVVLVVSFVVFAGGAAWLYRKDTLKA